MKYIFVFCFLWLAKVGANAQLAEGEMAAYRIEGLLTDDFKGYADDKGNIVVVYYTYKKDVRKIYKTHFLFLSDGYAKNITMPGRLFIEGFSYTDTSFTFSYRNEYAVDRGDYTLNLMEVDKKGEKMLGNNTLNLNKENRVLFLSRNGRQYLVSVVDDKKAIRFRVIRGADNIFYRKITSNPKLARKLASRKFYYADPDNEIKSLTLVDAPKAVVYQNRLYLLFLDQGSIKKSRVLTSARFDANDGSLQHFKAGLPYTQGNFFPLDNQVFFLSLTKDKLSLLVYRLGDLSLRSKIIDGAKENKLTVYLLKGDKPVLLAQERRFRAIARGDNLIGITRYGDKLKVKVGSFYQSVGSAGDGYPQMYSSLSDACFFLSYPDLTPVNIEPDEQPLMSKRVAAFLARAEKETGKKINRHSHVFAGPHLYFITYSKRGKRLAVYREPRDDWGD